METNTDFLTVVVRMLVKTHPNPEALRTLLDQEIAAETARFDANPELTSADTRRRRLQDLRALIAS